MEQDIKAEWLFWCRQNAELYMQEIAQARRVADYISCLEMNKQKDISVHVGSVSTEFKDKVAYFLPPTWVLENTDENLGWNNYLKVTIK